jgi:hypothetical protein
MRATPPGDALVRWGLLSKENVANRYTTSSARGPISRLSPRGVGVKD